MYSFKYEGEVIYCYKDKTLIYWVFNYNLYTTSLFMNLSKIVSLPDDEVDLLDFVKSNHDIILYNVNKFNELYNSITKMKFYKLPNPNMQFVNSDEYHIEYHKQCKRIRVLFSYNCDRKIDCCILFYEGYCSLYKLDDKFIGSTFDEINNVTIKYVQRINYIKIADKEFDEEFDEVLFINYVREFINNNKKLISFPDIPTQNIKSAKLK